MNELETYKKTLEVIGSCGDDSSRNLASKTLALFKPKPHPLAGLPVDIAREAELEIGMLGRPSANTSKALVAEIKALRAKLAAPTRADIYALDANAAEVAYEYLLHVDKELGVNRSVNTSKAMKAAAYSADVAHDEAVIKAGESRRLYVEWLEENK